jgi:sugar fermentation stimulation protein A
MTSSVKSLRLFLPPQEAFFIERPNRFLVRCRYNGEVVSAHLPNPGRLQELLLPDARVLIVPGKGKNPYTVVGIIHDGRVIMVHTHRTNTAVQWLLERNVVRGLKGATVIRPEVAHGRSRFDFLVQYRGRELYLEVKSCTLFGRRVAMFPDAVTARGARHLTELAELNRQGKQTAVLFVVHASDLEYFMPDYHTDIGFAKTFLAVREQVRFMAIGVRWNRDLSLRPETARLKIPWRFLEREVQDRGSYLLVLYLDRDRSIPIGGLGEVNVKQGYYVYVGSAMNSLVRRIERHRRLRKNMHWHIDYLRAVGTVRSALAIRASDRLECALADSVARISNWSVKGFGCGDCRCSTHLFGFSSDPLTLPSFQKLLLHYRMDRFQPRPRKA